MQRHRPEAREPGRSRTAGWRHSDNGHRPRSRLLLESGFTGAAEQPSNPESVRLVPLCWLHHRAYDTGRLELLPHLEPRWRADVAHAVLQLGLVGAYRRLGRSWAA
jgi:hypothetical protein